MTSRASKSIASRFETHVDRSGECWLWTGTFSAKGYGVLTFNYKQFRAHRVSWELANGRPVPEGMFVCHRCDTPACVRPEHLFIGTNDDNVQDCVRKGRRPRKLTREHVKAIRSLLRAGVSSIRALGRQYGVDESAIRNIERNALWRKESV